MTSPGKPALATEPPEPLDVVETPTSPSSGLALSRFEFEAGKGNEGTKILMVEWDTSAHKQDDPSEAGKKEADWEVSWEGKTTVLAIRDVDSDASGSIRRVYFLLPPGAPIPALVSIIYKGAADDGGGTPKGGVGGTVLRTQPMPAIFPAELTGKQEAGRRGVLHTIWAKKRLAELQAEIVAEMRTNGESVGLEMAMQERQWIVDHFGLAADAGGPKPTKLHIPQGVTGPTSPRSPIGGRLGEKLKGLKLATSPAELAAATQAAKSAKPRTQPLVTSPSPAASDMAVSSFASFGNRNMQPVSGGAGVSSLDAIVGSGIAPATAAGVKAGVDDATEEDLFALPMSPRSPEMKRSPFSIL
ncbi:hypothetical protein MMYC01_202803 [Madurella mycetomatis]|uniref:Uncharacterized protein n=1 Tax=Madurella mycetomatis TaxID=100816 RepID=A0A175VVN0_9PEZI|nr:hypothetical protein MMYC01_208858 [Madurella mycetomatis]KXX79772.1 hypothetical protein MMYC01_202803 [Madurella mycetomatis]